MLDDHDCGAAGAQILDSFGERPDILFGQSSRRLVQQRFGANRKQITTYAPVRHQGVQQIVVPGNVIEDWYMSGLGRGKCIASLPGEPPFYFEFPKF